VAAALPVESRPDLEAVLAERDAELAKRDAELAERDARIAQLEQAVTELKALNAKLAEKLGRNSRNSNKPSSSDGPGGGSRVGRRRKKPTGRKRGGQKGHKGAHRRLLEPEQVDEVHDLHPEHCEGCAAQLAKRVCKSPIRFQQVDIRDGKRHVEEWRLHDGRCLQCGTRTQAKLDPARVPATAFGPGLVAVVGVLTGVYHLSRRQAKNALQDLFQISISLGSVSNLEHRASEALAPAYEEATQAVEEALVKHTDATSWLRSGSLKSLWVLACTTATVYFILGDGKGATIRPLFGALVGILVSDRASVFGFWAMRRRQICWAHLIRKFVAYSERDGPEGAIGAELLACAGLVFEYWHGYRQDILTREELQFWMLPLRRHVESLLRRAAFADHAEVSGSCRDILAHLDALWTFVDHEGVEPTNNHAELMLRAFVLWRKKSFGTQSERGERFAERIMSVAQTAKKQGRAILEFLTEALKAHARGTRGPQLVAA
jgi:transposase